jgi:acyl-coenzyme A thioesterase PaaI-like protein
MTTAHIPDGFVPLFRSSPFLESVGNFYFSGLGADMRIGVFVEPRATNLRGVAHGGFLSALCDVALGYALSTSQTPTARLVTASLSVEFAVRPRLATGSRRAWISSTSGASWASRARTCT